MEKKKDFGNNDFTDCAIESYHRMPPTTDWSISSTQTRKSNQVCMSQFTGHCSTIIGWPIRPKLLFAACSRSSDLAFLSVTNNMEPFLNVPYYLIFDRLNSWFTKVASSWLKSPDSEPAETQSNLSDKIFMHCPHNPIISFHLSARGIADQIKPILDWESVPR